jgi:hypothetical protein
MNPADQVDQETLEERILGDLIDSIEQYVIKDMKLPRAIYKLAGDIGFGSVFAPISDGSDPLMRRSSRLVLRRAVAFAKRAALEITECAESCLHEDDGGFEEMMEDNLDDLIEKAKREATKWKTEVEITEKHLVYAHLAAAQELGEISIAHILEQGPDYKEELELIKLLEGEEDSEFKPVFPEDDAIAYDFLSVPEQIGVAYVELTLHELLAAQRAEFDEIDQEGAAKYIEWERQACLKRFSALSREDVRTVYRAGAQLGSVVLN